MTKTLGFKASALIASTALCVAIVSGCNPEEPAKPVTPAPTVKTTPAKTTDAKGAAPAPAPKPAEEHK